MGFDISITATCCPCNGCPAPSLLCFGDSQGKDKSLCGEVKPGDTSGKVYMFIGQECGPKDANYTDSGTCCYADPPAPKQGHKAYSCTTTYTLDPTNHGQGTQYTRNSTNGDCSSEWQTPWCNETWVNTGTTITTISCDGTDPDNLCGGSCAGSGSQGIALSPDTTYDDPDTVPTDATILGWAKAKLSIPGSPNGYCEAGLGWGPLTPGGGGQHDSVWVAAFNYQWQFEGPKTGYLKITWDLVFVDANGDENPTAMSYTWTGDGGSTEASGTYSVPVPSTEGNTYIDNVCYTCTEGETPTCE